MEDLNYLERGTLSGIRDGYSIEDIFKIYKDNPEIDKNRIEKARDSLLENCYIEKAPGGYRLTNKGEKRLRSNF